MLSKLLKYEFKSTARVFLPMYVILLGFALLSRFSIAGMDSKLGDNDFAQILFGITIFGYALIIFSTLIVTMIIVVQRFYKNLTGDEGYLMHTLPVSTHKLLQAKIMTAFVWQVASGVAIMLSVFLLLFQPEFIAELREVLPVIGEFFADLVSEIGTLRLVANIGMLCLLVVVSGLTSILMIYAAISIGHTFKSHRIVGAVAAYIGLMMLGQMITGFVGAGVSLFNIDDYFNGYMLSASQVSEQVLGLMCIIAIIEIGFGCAWYFISHYVLSSQLNLE